MNERPPSVADDRPLTSEEAILTRWLLNHGSDGNDPYIRQLNQARVVSRCSCGCASINFSVDGIVGPLGALSVLADFSWETPEGWLCGVFAFARGNLLAGLEVWSIDGLTTPKSLPRPDQLEPICH